MSERDASLTVDAGLGAALDADLADGIPLVGFAEDADGRGDIAFIGFDDEPASPGGVSLPGGYRRGRLGEAVRNAGSAARQAASRLLGWLHFQFFGTAFRARRSRAAAVFVGAVVLSIGCGVVLRHFLSTRQAGDTAKAVPIAAVPAPVKSVLVARQAISRGRVLNATDLQWAEWPASDIKQSYVRRSKRRIPDLYGYVARRPIAEGEAIDNDSIVNPGNRGALAAVLPPGMRAISIDIREETAAAGLVMPGDDVDLVLALPVPAREGTDDASSRYAVQTVLSNVRVLAIDQQIAGHDGRSIIGRTATLEVTPKQAEIATLAGTMAQDAGNLRLALRSLTLAAAAAPALRPAEQNGRSFLVESDISRLMPDRKDAAAVPAAKPLTIVRGGVAVTEQPSGRAGG